MPPIEVAASAIACVICSARQPEQRPGRDRAAEDRGDRAMEAALEAARGERLVDAPCDLVAEHHRPQHVAAARTGALGHRDRGRARRWCRCARCCADRCRPKRRRRSSPRSRAPRRRRGACARHRTRRSPPRVPPRSLASSRMIREDTMSAPIAALAIVLAITMRARSSARGGRSSTPVLVTKRASSPAMLIVLYPPKTRSYPISIRRDTEST